MKYKNGEEVTGAAGVWVMFPNPNHTTQILAGEVREIYEDINLATIMVSTIEDGEQPFSVHPANCWPVQHAWDLLNALGSRTLNDKAPPV